MPAVFHHRKPFRTMRVASTRRVLVIADWRVLLKLCFQVFIVLSSADEAGTCRVHEGAWGGAAFKG